VLKQEEGDTPAPRLMHEASLTTVSATPKSAQRKLTMTLPEELAAAVKAKPVTTPTKKAPASAKAASKAQPAAAKAKVSISPAKPKQAEMKIARADPLAPIPKPKKASAPKKIAGTETAKDSSKTR